jgi:hypothetical protein
MTRLLEEVFSEINPSPKVMFSIFIGHSSDCWRKFNNSHINVARDDSTELTISSLPA